MTNEEILDSIVTDGTGIEVTQDEAIAAMNLARADEREGKWIPITGEDSLPKDDEALCLFAEWVNGIMATSWLTRCKEAKQEPNIEAYTHYTIVTPPNQ